MQFINLFLFAQLTILHAGSLSAMMDELTKKFKEETGIVINRRAGGSLFLANLIREKRVEWDIFFSADYNIISNLKGTFSDTLYPFASNELVVAFTKKSKYSNEINENNWVRILSRSGLRIGRSDPEQDPCGYRVLLLFEILKTKYGDTLVQKIMANSSEKNVRPKAAEVANLLEIGELDYAFLYINEALTRNLKFIELKDSLNFGNPKLQGYYRQFQITLKSGKIVQGDPIVYAFCINKNSERKEEIEIFLNLWAKHRNELLKKYNFKSL
jgi:molybdate/tungstate transport system substrate-binding protein